MEAQKTSSSLWRNLGLAVKFLIFLYLFLVSMQLMGSAFKLFGKGFAERLIQTTSAPLTGLFIGLLATSIVQSSSSTTSMVVSFVAAGVLTLHNAIPIIMGANIGTTVTNVLVSLGHINRKEEFRRAFSASLVHDIFNILSVAIIFPLQYYFGFLEKISLLFEKALVSTGGLTFSSPLQYLTHPAAEFIAWMLGDSAWLQSIISLALLFISLRYMVVYMKALVIERAEVVFEQAIFKTPYHGFLVGLLLTSLVQSSSVTTSLIVPLAGTGMITLRQVFPYTLGANVGTTVTALMAALAIGNTSGLTVAMSHLLFNISGIAVFWWIQFVPIGLAEKIAGLAVRNRGYAIAYLLLIFYLIPLTLIYLLR